jgi:hypothetical protein
VLVIQARVTVRLVGGIQPRAPYADHALVVANAALTETRGTCGPLPMPMLPGGRIGTK